MESSSACSMRQAARSASLAFTPKTPVKKSLSSLCLRLTFIATASPSFVRVTGLYFSYSTSPFSLSELSAAVTDGLLTLIAAAMSDGRAAPVPAESDEIVSR